MKAISALICIIFIVQCSSSEFQETESFSNEYEKNLNCQSKAINACGGVAFPPKIPSNEQELQSFCSYSLSYLPCSSEETEKCLGFNPFADKLTLIIRTLEKVCDEDSVWHKALIKHLMCTEREITSYNEICPGEIRKITKALSSPLNIDVNKYENLDSDSNDELKEMYKYHCFKTALGLSCLQRNIEKCGTEAGNVSLEIIKSLGYHVGACPNEMTAPYNSALDNMGLNDQELTSIRNMIQLLAENSAQLHKDSKKE